MFLIGFTNIIFAVSAQAGLLGVNSTLELVDAESPEEFWQVSVRCEGSSEPKYIVTRNKQGPWCVKGLSNNPSFCASKKFNAGLKACSRESRRALKALEQADQVKELEALENETKMSELLKQKQALQDELLVLEQRKLDVLKSEAELDRQELQIKKRLSEL